MKKHRVCIPQGTVTKRREAPFEKWTPRSGGHWVGHRLQKTVCGHVDAVARFASGAHQRNYRNPKTSVNLIVRVGDWLYAIPRTGMGRVSLRARRRL